MQLIILSKRLMAWVLLQETGKSKMSHSSLQSEKSACATRWAWCSNKMASNDITILVCSRFLMLSQKHFGTATIHHIQIVSYRQKDIGTPIMTRCSKRAQGGRLCQLRNDVA